MPLEYLLVAEIPKNATISFRKGVARLREGAKPPRNFDGYYNNVLLPQIATGMIEERDLKLRFSGYDISMAGFFISAGPTSFGEYKEAFNGDLPDLGKIAKLKEEGRRATGDKWARLARPIGLTAVVLDATDAYLLAERKESREGKSSVTEYAMFWHSPAGYLNFTEYFNDIDLPALARKFVERDYHILPDSIERITPKLIAANPDSGETDIVLIVRTSLPPDFKLEPNPDKYISWKRVEKSGVKEFAANRNFVYSTAAALSLA